MNRSCLSRRHFLHRGAFGLAWLLPQDGRLADPAKPARETPHFDLLPKKPHFVPRAKAMISMFMQGGPSQLDLFDPKPELDKLDGQKLPGEVKYDDAAHASTKVLASPWKFQKHGQCGTEVSELLPLVGLAVGQAGLEAAAGDPHREAVGGGVVVVVADDIRRRLVADCIPRRSTTSSTMPAKSS